MFDSGTRMLRILFFSIWCIAGVHILAEYYFWYWTMRWFDIPMHLLGGAWLGASVLWLRNDTRYFTGLWKHLRFNGLPLALLGGLCVGIVWEGYELLVRYIGNAPFSLSVYVYDTATDIIADVLGAVAGYVLYTRVKNDTGDKKNTTS
jgi:hypothetical protein